MTARHVAVIDIGKTNAKLALVDLDTLREIAVVTRPNTVMDSPPWPHFDVDGHWDFLLCALSDFHKSHGVDVISVTTHGACAALIGQDGRLAAPILDYEHDGPDTVAKDYDAIRPAFVDTGSPRLPMGLNLGAQLHWQFSTDPSLLDKTKAIVTYPQYWGYRLTGKTACDMSSLGCHTDLWRPYTSEISTLAHTLGIADKLAPARKSAEVLGTVLPGIATRTGLGADTPVLCGIHDSNASLLPHILRRTAPFSVVSTGTWVIAMTVGGQQSHLDATRDVLVNVSAQGEPVPSARFMGGREYEILIGGCPAAYGDDDLASVAQDGPMLLPSVVSDSGPFQGRAHQWLGKEPPYASPERSVAVGFYLALMTAECLCLTAHDGPIIIEGPFAANSAFCAMLAAASGCLVEAADGATGTSEGAALLALRAGVPPPTNLSKNIFPPRGVGLSAYATKWQSSL